jgi:hypothetical protein
VTFKEIFIDFATKLEGADDLSGQDLIQQVMSTVHDFERRAIALASSANASNDWNGQPLPFNPRTNLVSKTAIEDIIRWFSFGIDYHLLELGPSVLANASKYPAPDPATRFTPPNQYSQNFDTPYHRVMLDALERAASTDGWDFVCAGLVLRWFLRMPDDLPKANWLGLGDNAQRENKVTNARNRLSELSLLGIAPNSASSLLTVIGWGKGFGEYCPTPGRIFVEPIVCSDPKVANLVEIGLYPFGVKSRRNAEVWTNWADGTKDPEPDDGASSWPYLNAKKWKRVVARRRAAILWAGSNRAPEKERRWGRDLLVECGRYGWKVRELKEMIRESSQDTHEVIPAERLAAQGELNRRMNTIRTAIKVRELGGVQIGRQNIFNVVVFGFSVTGKTTVLCNLLEHWSNALRLQGNGRYLLPAGWDGVELNQEWLRAGMEEARQTKDPISITVPITAPITVPFSNATIKSFGVRCIDMPGEWFMPNRENAANNIAIQREFLHEVLSNADLCIVLSPLKNLEGEEFTQQLEVLSEFVVQWREMGEQRRALAPAILCCLNFADEARDWVQIGLDSPLLVKGLRPGIAHDLEAQDLLSPQLVPTWLNQNEGDLSTKIVRSMKQFTGNPNFQALSLAVVGGSGKVPEWGNRERLQNAKQIADEVISIVKTRYESLDQERFWASWLKNGSVPWNYRAKALGPAFRDLVFGPTPSIP